MINLKELNDKYHIVFIIIISIIILCLGEIVIENFVIIKKSELDNNEYKVQDYNNPHIAADILATINLNIKKLQTFLINKLPNDERIIRFNNRLKETNIEEALHEENSSSYTLNKGELIAMCIRHKNHDKDFHNINTLMFVVIHELAHIMSVSEGHTTEFMRNFKFLLEQSKKCGIYIPEDYSKTPINYCGVDVNHNPFYS